jgi:hypothetical protein
MASTPHDSTGTSLVFDGTTFTVTNLTLNYSDVRERIDISNLGQTTGEQVASQDAPLVGTADDTGVEISFDYIGTNELPDNTSGTLTIAGGLSLSRSATVASSNVTLAVNDVIRGSATLRVAAS